MYYYVFILILLFILILCFYIQYLIKLHSPKDVNLGTFGDPLEKVPRALTWRALSKRWQVFVVSVQLIDT